MDSVNGICPLIDSQGIPQIAELVKSHRVTSWLLEKQSKIILTTRHFSLVNPRLLQLCAFDKVIEMKAPSQQQRYQLIKQEIASVELFSKEVTL